LNHAEQLEWERRAGRPAAAAAIASALLGMIALVVGAKAGLLSPADDKLEILLRNDRHPGAYMVTAVLQAISTLLITPVLLFLYRAAKYRRAETPSVARLLALLAPPAVAVLTVANAIKTLDTADKVASLPPLAPKAAVHRAEDLATQGSAATIGWLAVVAALSLAFAVGLNSVNARRAGLLSQFLGILGVIVGVLLVIPIIGPPIVQFFWFVALGLLFIDRWPGQRERGAAWETGEPDPWPTTAELRAEQNAERIGREPERASPEPEEPGEEYEDHEEPGAQHPRSKKRKRKRRR
jgi:hypothetical protein